MCFLVTKCCFCININAGAKIIAVLSLMVSILTLVMYGGAALALPASWTRSKQCFYLVIAAVSLCQVVLCVLLIYGTFWVQYLGRKPRYLWPWLVACWIFCGCLVFLTLLGVILLILQYYDNVETFDEITTMSTFYFMYAAIIYYCTIVVNSRREQMVPEEEIEAVENLMRRRYNIPKNLLV